MSAAPTQVAGADAVAAAQTSPEPVVVSTPAPAPAVPAKFLNPDGTVNVANLAKSYVELEKRSSAPPAPPAAPAPPLAAPPAAPPDAPAKPNLDPLAIVPPTAPVPLSDDATPTDVLKAAGLDPEALGKKFIENGDIEDSDYAALKAIGYPKGVVKNFMAQQADMARQTIAKLRSDAAAIVGGEQQLDALRTWAGKNLSPEEQSWYMAQTKSPKTAMLGVEWLNNRYLKAVGGSGSAPLVGGNAPGPAKAMTQQDAANAMRDPRYAPQLANGAPNPKYDAAFRQRVLASM